MNSEREPSKAPLESAIFWGHICFRKKISAAETIKDGRTWAIAVGRGLYESLFLLNSGLFFRGKQGKISSEVSLYSL